MALTNLKGIQALGQVQLTEKLLANVTYWLDWGFLTLGGYFNITAPQSGVFGGSQHRLRPVSDPNYSDGQVWEGFRSNWVWESGINLQHDGNQPIAISGITVNGTFYSSNTSGAYSHYINYPDGRVIFDSPISTTANVNCNYSYKWVKFLSVESPEFKQLMYSSMRVDDPTFLSTSGSWNQNSSSRVEMPAVFIEILNRREHKPLELGGGQKALQTIYFHIFTEEPWTKNNIVDALSSQNFSTIRMFNVESGAQNVLDYRGSITSSTRTYPELISLFPQADFYIYDAQVKGVQSLGPLFRGQVAWKVETWLKNL